MITQTRLIIGEGYNPHRNLALEKYLATITREQECILYLWQNQNTVVIGKNQNAWKECRTQLLEEEGGVLARRPSGGGAVFHDLGNLNFTFVVDRSQYNLERQLGVILDAVNSFGLNAEFSGRNDLVLEGQKFSGNAFSKTANVAVHHGTLLLDVDMTKLSRYLQVSPQKMQAKGIESVRSRVCNLIDYVPGLTIEDIRMALVKSFSIHYLAPELLTMDDIDPNGIQPYIDQYSSWEWNYGKTPEFDVELSNRFTWGQVDICLTMENGTVTMAKVFSDAMDEVFIENIGPTLIGCPYKASELAYRINQIECEELTKATRSDLADWIAAQEL